MKLYIKSFIWNTGITLIGILILGILQEVLRINKYIMLVGVLLILSTHCFNLGRWYVIAK